MTMPHLSDAELAGQPAAYWTGVAYESLIAFTRAQQAAHASPSPSSGSCATCPRTTFCPAVAG
ncbi:hypothetical protein V2I01_41105 [Micromonospora sp. BRA006-A]|nr:hypothetical protein [Micromonospora sp. BRA006-A]